MFIMRSIFEALVFKVAAVIGLSVLVGFGAVLFGDYPSENMGDLMKFSAVMLSYVALATFPWFELGWVAMDLYLDKKNA